MNNSVLRQTNFPDFTKQYTNRLKNVNKIYKKYNSGVNKINCVKTLFSTFAVVVAVLVGFLLLFNLNVKLLDEPSSSN